jgi:hypothetical protein
MCNFAMSACRLSNLKTADLMYMEFYKEANFAAVHAVMAHGKGSVELQLFLISTLDGCD